MNLYRIGYGVMATVGFLARMLMRGLFIGIVALVVIDAWQHDRMLSLLAVCAVVVGIFAVIASFVMLTGWLERKAFARPSDRHLQETKP